jgi:hypothetical protein
MLLCFSPRKSYWLLASALPFWVALPVLAHDSLPQISGLVSASEIPDSELGTMCGRYVNGNQVTYFGVTMTTQWQMSNGRYLDSGINLNVNSSLQPTISVYSSMQQQKVETPSGSHPVVSINSGGLGNITGVVQGIQIGGNGNGVSNNIGMDINLNAQTPEASAASGKVLSHSGSQIYNQGGVITTVTIAPNDISMAIKVPGQGQVLQQLQAGSGLKQLTQLGGDFNQVQNMIKINAGLRATPGANIGQIQTMLETMKGLPR